MAEGGGMKLQIEISDEQAQRLVDYAISCGFLREEPRKAWNRKEYKEAIRYAMEKMVYMTVG